MNSVPHPYPRKPFRTFCYNCYYENRDEYDSFGQQQPFTFEQYVRDNIDLLKAKYRLTRQNSGAIVRA